MRNKYMLLPTEEQKVMLEKTFKCCREVRNEILYRAINIYEETHDVKGISGDFLGEKWEHLKEVDQLAIANTISCTAFNFISHIDKERKELRPTYTTENEDQVYHTYNERDNNIVIVDDTIMIPKVGFVKMDLSDKVIPEDNRVSSIFVELYRNDPDEYGVFIIFMKDMENN